MEDFVTLLPQGIIAGPFDEMLVHEFHFKILGADVHIPIEGFNDGFILSPQVPPGVREALMPGFGLFQCRHPLAQFLDFFNELVLALVFFWHLIPQAEGRAVISQAPSILSNLINVMDV
ncbi:MAG: hypothetical protein ABIG94_06875 [Pseudomonadota bacterium]